MVVSGKYIKYRSLSYCIYCDVRDSIKKKVKAIIDALRGRKKEKPKPKKNDGFGRWKRTEWGGGEV